MALMTKPGVVLTFDDHFIEEWLRADRLFRRFNARVTFFICEFDRLSPRQIGGLQQLKSAGHAIGCHGLHHLDAVEFLRQNSEDEYVETEILPALRAMEQAGLPPSSFAYPMSSNNAHTDRLLRTHFRHLRSGAFLNEEQRLCDVDRIFTHIDQLPQTDCLYGKSIDAGADFSLHAIRDAFTTARRNAQVITFYSHNIAQDDPGNHIRPVDLESVLTLVREHGLTFYTFDDLP